MEEAMPRKPRLFVSGATYHVYCRVARGEFVFENPDNAEAFIETLRDVRMGATCAPGEAWGGGKR